MIQSGVLPGKTKERVTLRIQSIEPYSAEVTSDQIGVIADIAEKFGSGKVHVTARQTIEIPHINKKYLKGITGTLKKAGLYLGSTDRNLRNITACSRWCLFNAVPVSDLAQRLNKKLRNTRMPAKTNISLSGCDFSCVRSRTSDIGVIARAKIALSDKKCKNCSLCIKEPLGCQVDAIKITGKGKKVKIDYKKCIECGFCTNVCKPSSIIVASKSFDIFVGGNGGLKPRKAKFYAKADTEKDLLKIINKIINTYSSNAGTGERIGEWMERLGQTPKEALDER